MGLEYCKPDTSGAYKPWEVVEPQLKEVDAEAMAYGNPMNWLKLDSAITNVNRVIEEMKNA